MANYQAWVRFEKNSQRLREQLDCLEFTYKVDGLAVEGYVVKPKQPDGRKLPVLIYNRGGNSRAGMISFSDLRTNHMVWADQGYIVISSQYRGVGLDEFGGRDVNDVLALLPIIDGMPDADTQRIGMIGFSRGGMMTYLAAARSNRIKAIVIWGGVSDLKAEISRRPEMEQVYKAHIPGYAENRDQVLRDRSALYWLDRIDTKLPILLLHGSNDARVSVVNASGMAEKLKERGQVHKLVIIPGADHSLIKYRTQSNAELLGWFNQYLPLKQDASHIN